MACTSRSNDSRTVMVSVECSTNYVQIMRDKFGSSPYILKFIYGDENCIKLSVGFGYPASGTCVGGYNETGGYIFYYVIANLNEDGSASLQFYPDRACLSSNLAMVESGDQTAVRSHSCGDNGIKWYGSNDAETIRDVLPA